VFSPLWLPPGPSRLPRPVPWPESCQDGPNAGLTHARAGQPKEQTLRKVSQVLSGEHNPAALDKGTFCRIIVYGSLDRYPLLLRRVGSLVRNRNSRDAILRAARDLFTKKGFANTSVREICGKAEVTVPSLYYHFGDKDGLFQAVVAESLNLDHFCASLVEAVEGCDRPQEKLRAYTGAYLSNFPDELLNPGLFLTNSTRLNESCLRRFAFGLNGAYELAKEIIASGISAGEFREVEIDTVAACLMGTIDSFVRSRFYLGAEYEIEEVTECIVDLFTRGLVVMSNQVSEEVC